MKIHLREANNNQMFINFGISTLFWPHSNMQMTVINMFGDVKKMYA